MKHMKTLKGLALGITVAAFMAPSAQAETTLRVSSWAPPTHTINANMWGNWAKAVEEATEGRVKVAVEYGLAPPPAQFDLVRDGAADATWIFHGYNPGRFVATQIPELPGVDANSEAMSVAYWRTHDKYLAKANEHRGVKLIGLTLHTAGVLQTHDPVNSLDDISGKKLRIGGGVSGDVGKALGAVGVNVPAPKVYETVATKVADGVMMPFETRKSFKLADITKNVYSMPGGFYFGSFAMVLNQDFYDGLSDQDKAALDGVTGEYLSRLAGQAWDTADTAGLEYSKVQGAKHVVASEADTAKFQGMIKSIETEVLGRVSEKGIDAEAALANYRKEASGYSK